MTSLARACARLLLALFLLHAGQVSAQQMNGVLREVYLNIPGNSVADLTNHSSFPASPGLETIQPQFEAPTEFGDNYGQRMRALLIAPTNGTYTFWVAGDDNAALYLSTNEDPATRVRIAYVNSWTSSREWTKETNQQSALIPLTGGQRYYIEALEKEGTGGDNLAVRWRLPNGTIEEPIPGNRLLVYGLAAPLITQQPADTSVVESGTATFRVQLARYIGASFQWRRNGTNIPGANSASLLVGPLTLSDSGSLFSCAITNMSGGTNTREAMLTVTADTTRPTVSSVVNLGDNQYITLTFSEPVEEASASATTNYFLNNNADVFEAVLADDFRSVVLKTSPLAFGSNYIVTINHVRDRAITPNTIQTNTQRSFSLSYSALDPARLNGAIEPLGPSSRRTGLVISEIMYHPLPRADERNIEFVEIYNSQEWAEDLSGYRLEGQVEFTFPPGSNLNPRSFLVVAAVPADLQAASGVSASLVRGPFIGALSNGGGTVRLRNRLGAVLLEAEYSGDPPYPVAADGAGHSLVLARPSFGERSPQAWRASDRVGGSPGAQETAIMNPQRTIVINEFLADSESPEGGFLEVFNYGSSSVGLAGCVLTDDPETNKFIIPAGTVIPPRGFLAFTEAQLGFGLSAGGETIYLKNTNSTRIIDAMRFGGQMKGVSIGRYPDGAPALATLRNATIGAVNTRKTIPDVVISEIMYHPISGDNDDEYLELHNHSTNTLLIEGWRLSDGVNFSFPPGTVMPAGTYLVVAENVNRFMTNYPNVDRSRVFGNYSGNLANGGERIALTMPAEVTETNDFGVVFTNRFRIVVDEVTYGTGGRWGKWSDGGGSSLELIDPRSDGQLAPAWNDSNDSVRSGWKTVEWTGVLDHGQAAADTLQLFMLGAGECLVDDIEVLPTGSGNVISNPSFGAGLQGWTAQGNQDKTGWSSAGGIGNTPCLHLRATGRGDTGANRVWAPLTTALTAGSTATVRARVRWLKGNPEILLRLRGSWLEATANMLTTHSFGTPGAMNSAQVPNAPPTILNVSHSPLLPAGNQTISVSAHVVDSDALARLQLRYRVDPNTNHTVVSMVYNGAGHYSATIPAQAAGALVAFYIEAEDIYTPRAASRFPDDAPQRECLVRFGDTIINNNFGNYRFWITQNTLDRWIAREKLSNDALDSTFIYGNSRVIYNIGAQYSGSPYHSPGYNSPLGNVCDYVLTFPDDDPFLGDNDINLVWPGNGGGDGSLQREQTAYWIAYQLGLPYTHRRHVNVIVNGVRRGSLMEDSQQPNRDMADQWYPEGEDGNLHKIQLWFEFDGAASGFSAVGASLGNWTTTGGIKKLARYRWNWAARAFRETANNYTNLFALMDAATTSANGEAYTRIIEGVMDVDQWLRTIAVEHIVGNVDSYAYGGGQNMYTYKPLSDTWKLMIWDIDFAFAYGTPQDDLFGFSDGQVQRIYNHPPFRRMYLRALQDAANGPLVSLRVDPTLDARYNAFVAAGVAPENPAAIKSYIAQRRTYILQQLTNHISNFSVDASSSFSTNRNLIALSGSAPFDIESVTVNGAVFRATWTAWNRWTILYALAPGENQLNIQGLNNKGLPVAGAQTSLTVHYTGGIEQPEDKLVINEIMYNPRIANAGYIELHNTSLSNAFDLTGCRLDGVDFEFEIGTVIEPGGFLIIAQNRNTFGSVYGASLPIAGEFPGTLSNDGETIQLRSPQGETLDQVTFDSEPPWPTVADGSGPSLQLIDPLIDNDRVANWAAVSAGVTNPPQSLISMTHVWRYQQTSDLTGVPWTTREYSDAAWPTGAALLYVEGAALPAPKSTALTLGRTTYYFRTRFNLAAIPGGASLKLHTILDDGAVFYLNGAEILRLGMPNGIPSYGTLATRGVGDATIEGPFILPATSLVQGENVLAVEVHQNGTTSSDIVFGMSLETTYETISFYTPGAVNSVRAGLPPFPTVWLNELMPTNFFIGGNGILDSAGDRDPWVELYNSGSNALSLNGFYLSPTLGNLGHWPFPPQASVPPGGFLVVWLDAEPNESSATELHANFGIGEAGIVTLSRSNSIIDYLKFDAPNVGRSYGSFPDGNVSRREELYYVTPGGTNNAAPPPLRVTINEWMASNTGFIPDPADNNYEDWIELFNADDIEADLEDFYLTDTVTNKTKWKIPNGTVIPARGYLLVWADEETSQNGPGGELHTNFRLGAGGEELALYAPDGQLVDVVSFGPQTPNISQGRFTDGQGAIFFMTNPTPRSANSIQIANSPPTLSAIANQTINEGEILRFTGNAADAEAPPQILTFSLLAPVPAGAAVSPNGEFTWTPSEAQGPGTFPIALRVHDNGIPSMSATQAFTVTVFEVNNAPVLTPFTNQVVNETATLKLAGIASDPDGSEQTLTFSLDSGPAGLTVSPLGTISWVPQEADGPGNYTAIVRVSDDGTPSLSDTKPLSIFVHEVNQPPSASAPGSAMIHAEIPTTISLSATDGDLPAQALTFTISPALPGAEITSNALTWTPPGSYEGTTNQLQLTVTDSIGMQSLPANFTIVVGFALRPEVRREGETALFSWETLPNRTYQLEYKTNLVDGAWTALGPSILADGSRITVAELLNQEQRFYRVRLD